MERTQMESLNAVALDECPETVQNASKVSRRARLEQLTAKELLAFFSKVCKVDTGVNSCWEWTGYRDKDGYGMFGLRRKGRRAHCVAWTIEHGQIPDGLELDHLCRNRACVRPDHMELVTHRENLLRGHLHRPRGAHGYFCASDGTGV